MPAHLTDRDYQRLLALRTGIRRFLHWSEAQAAAVGLTAAQHQLLLAVRGHEATNETTNGPTVGEIADVLVLRHHSAVGLIDRVVALGLVERARDTLDHRIVRIRLTPSGHQRLDALSVLHLEELERLAPPIRSIWAGLDA